MKQNQIKELNRLDAENLENIFNVYQDQDGRYFYNLLQTIVFPQNLPASLFNTYVVKYGDTWPYISFKNYNNPNLWWVILMANNIQDATIIPKNGTELQIPISQVVRQILTQIGK